jgi:hypothetical protein
VQDEAFSRWNWQADEQHRLVMPWFEDEKRYAAAQRKRWAATSDSIGGAAKQFLLFTGMTAGLSAVKGMATSIVGEFNKTVQWLREAAGQFQGLRKTRVEVTTLRGEAPSTKSTVEEARKARAFGLTSEERPDFQAEFLNYAGSQVGGPEGKLTEAEGKAYRSRVAGMMEASGIAPSVGAGLGGSLLEHARAKQNVGNLMQRFGKVFQVLEKGRVPLTRALPQLSKIMGMGVSTEEADRMFAIALVAALDQEGVAGQANLRAIQGMKNKGTGEEFGVKRGMGQYESVKAFAENLKQRRKALVGQGKTEHARDELAAVLKQCEVIPDVREARGLFSGTMRQGVQLHGFERYKGFEAVTPADFEPQRRRNCETSNEGRASRIAVMKEVEQAEAGARNEPIKRRKDLAVAELLKNRTFESFGWEDVKGGVPNFLGGPNKRGIMIRHVTLACAHTELGKTSGIKDNAASLNNGPFEAMMRELVQRIEEEHRQGIYRRQFSGSQEDRAANTKAIQELTTVLSRVADGSAGKPGTESAKGPAILSAAVPLTAPPPRPPQRM